VTAPPGAPRTRITTARQPRSVSLTRARLTRTLHRWNVPPTTVDDAALLLSELLTNAVQHGTGPTVTILASYEHGTVRCQVHNDTPPPPPGTTPSPAPPTTPPRPPDPLAEAGRGLHLVHTLATRWGTHSGPDQDRGPTDLSRRIVWFHLDVTGTPPGQPPPRLPTRPTTARPAGHTPPVCVAETDPDILRRVLAALRAK
jgi:anti-sigma regulatory factor (Ser/Thr protein kinase)